MVEREDVSGFRGRGGGVAGDWLIRVWCLVGLSGTGWILKTTEKRLGLRSPVTLPIAIGLIFGSFTRRVMERTSGAARAKDVAGKFGGGFLGCAPNVKVDGGSAGDEADDGTEVEI